MSAYDSLSDKVTRALAAAEEADRARVAQPRADRAYLVADAARRYGLPDDLAAEINGDGPTEIQRDARRLALGLAHVRRNAEAEGEDQGVTDDEDQGVTDETPPPVAFDPVAVARAARR